MPKISSVKNSAMNQTSAVAIERNTAVSVSSRASVRTEESPEASRTSDVRRRSPPLLPRFFEIPGKNNRFIEREIIRRTTMATRPAMMTTQRIESGLATNHSAARAHAFEPVHSKTRSQNQPVLSPHAFASAAGSVAARTRESITTDDRTRNGTPVGVPFENQALRRDQDARLAFTKSQLTRLSRTTSMNLARALR